MYFGKLPSSLTPLKKEILKKHHFGVYSPLNIAIFQETKIYEKHPYFK
jgi:hypothetical protein